MSEVNGNVYELKTTRQIETSTVPNKTSQNSGFKSLKTLSKSTDIFYWGDLMRILNIAVFVFLLNLPFNIYTKEKKNTEKVDFTTFSKSKLIFLKKELEKQLKKKTGMDFLCVMSDHFCIRGLNRLIRAKLPYMKNMPKYKKIKYIFLAQQNNHYQYAHLKRYLKKYKDGGHSNTPSEENFIEIDPLWQPIEKIRSFLKIPPSENRENSIIETIKPIMLRNTIDKTLLGPTFAYERCLNCDDDIDVIIPCAKEEKFYDKLYKDKIVTGTIVFGYKEFNEKNAFKIYNDFTDSLIKKRFKKIKEGKNNSVYELTVYYKGMPKKWRLNIIRSTVKCVFFEREANCMKRQEEHSNQVLKEYSKSMSSENISVYTGHMYASRQNLNNPHTEIGLGPGTYKLKLNITNPKAGVIFYNSCWSSESFKPVLMDNYTRENYRLISSNSISMFGNMANDVINMITAMLDGRCSDEIVAYINKGRTNVVMATNDPGMRTFSKKHRTVIHYDRAFPSSVQVDKIDVIHEK